MTTEERLEALEQKIEGQQKIIEKLTQTISVVDEARAALQDKVTPLLPTQ